jgi:hypothetical protein
MCSIRAKPCFIHMFSLSVHPYWLYHVSHDLFCMLRVWCPYCICMYLNYFMHVHARFEGLRVYARIPSLACLCTCLFVSKAERAFASVCFYRGTRVYLHSMVWVESWASVRMLLLVSSAIVYMCLKRCLLACFKSWACAIIQFPVSRAERVCACSFKCAHVSRADHASSFSWPANILGWERATVI